MLRRVAPPAAARRCLARSARSLRSSAARWDRCATARAARELGLIGAAFDSVNTEPVSSRDGAASGSTTDVAATDPVNREPAGAAGPGPIIEPTTSASIPCGTREGDRGTSKADRSTTDPKAATYEISSYIVGIEQLTVTTLRNVIGSMDLEETLTSRDAINGQLRGVLDEATGRWGIRVNRVELKAIDPPPSVQESMEKQLKAERERRAAILTAEGEKQSAILTAEGAKQSAVLTAQGQAEAEVLRAEADAKSQVIRADGEAAAVEKVYTALHQANPTSSALAHRYLETLPEIANGEASKVWVVPSELTSVVQGLKDGFTKERTT